jgi:uncharacterized membrane protein
MGTMTITQRMLGVRPYVLVELDDGEAVLDMGGSANPDEARYLLRQASRGLKQARRILRKRAREAKRTQHR